MHLARRLTIAAAAVVVVAATALAGCGGDDEQAGGTTTQATAPPTGTGPALTPESVEVRTAAEGLEVPWGLDFAPDGTLFFTERPGRIGVLPPGGKPERIATLDDTFSIGEAGLLGLVLHPDFERTPQVFVYQSHRDGLDVRNRILRFRWDAGERRLTNRKTLLDGIPGSVVHDGGALAFGPDGLLYATTGDARQADDAQDPDALNGKVLRLTADGEVPADNPFGPGNPVYTIGHRNPEGLAFHPNGALYATEHGPDADDELNRIVAGDNYGWPDVSGRGGGDRFHEPIAVYDPTIAPAGLAVYTGPVDEWRGDLFWGTLGFTPDNGRHLRQADLASEERLESQDRLYRNRFGRLRPVRMGPDGCLWFGTSNRDGRGDPGPADDRLLRACASGGG